MMQHKVNYIYLLVFLVVSIAFAMSVRSVLMVNALGFCMIFGLCLSAYLVTHRRRDQMVLLPFGIIAISTYIMMLASQQPFLTHVLNKMSWMVFIGYLGAIVFREIFNPDSPASQKVFGAISIYILTGLFFAQTYEVLLIFAPESISFSQNAFGETALRGGDLIYFSFITFATVGYGDITPATPLARSICVMESICGVMGVAVLIDRFVAARRTASGN